MSHRSPIQSISVVVASLTLLMPLIAAAADSRVADAAKTSDKAAVLSLIRARADVNGRQADGSTALHWAAERDDLEFVDLLISAGANVKAATRYNITPLSLACTNGNAAIVEHLLRAGADANATSEDGQTALMTASLTGKVDAIKVLLAHGANPNAVEPYKGQTALMWAASEGNSAAAETLVEFRAEVKAKSKGGLTPLLFAVRNAEIDTVKVLLKHGANINDAAADGTSALNIAIVNSYFDLALFLLDNGADPNARDPRGSPLHTLAWLRKPGSDGATGNGMNSKGTPVPIGTVAPLDLARALLKRGANPNVRIDWKETRFGKEGGTAKNPPDINLGRHLLSYVGATAFYVAAKNGDAEYMRLLAENGADPKIATRAGITPLMVASGLDYWEGESPGPVTGVSEAERLEAVKLALDLGNDINAQANFGDYQMLGDAQYTLLSYPMNIEDLLDKGLGDPRWSGCTALIGGVVSGQPSIVRLLVDRGAQLDAKTKLGWTALSVAEGVFFANAKKEFPPAAEILRKAMTQRGMPAK